MKIEIAVSPVTTETLVDLLRQRAADQPHATAYSFVSDSPAQPKSLSYAALDRRARTIAARLQALDAQGQRALLLYQPGLDYLAAFFGCLYAGVIAVPAYPPSNNRAAPRIQAIVQDAQAMIVLTTAQMQAVLAERFAAVPGAKLL
jgi:acyl-CoA synthetase (AMP-forming)/AMP-acid ligase II